MKLSAEKDKLKLIFRSKLLWPSSLHPGVSITSVIYYTSWLGFWTIHWARAFKIRYAPLTTSVQSLMSFDHLGKQCSTKGGSVCTSLKAPGNIIKNIQFRSLFENDTFKIWAFGTTRIDSADLYFYNLYNLSLQNKDGGFSNIFFFPKMNPVKPAVSENHSGRSMGTKYNSASFRTSVGTAKQHGVSFRVTYFDLISGITVQTQDLPDFWRFS